jgi:hypothetical protein
MDGLFMVIGIFSLSCGLLLCALGTYRGLEWLLRRRQKKQYQVWLQSVIDQKDVEFKKLLGEIEKFPWENRQ